MQQLEREREREKMEGMRFQRDLVALFPFFCFCFFELFPGFSVVLVIPVGKNKPKKNN